MQRVRSFDQKSAVALAAPPAVGQPMLTLGQEAIAPARRPGDDAPEDDMDPPYYRDTATQLNSAGVADAR